MNEDSRDKIQDSIARRLSRGAVPELVPYRFVPDVIWGRIMITELENRVLETPIFSRLREVKQMGVAKVHFSGAVHTRYEHSIGVMHVTDQMLRIVRLGGLPGYEPYLIQLLDERERMLLRLAALLHDLGHPPLSHVLEEGFRKYPELLSSRKAEPNVKEFLNNLLQGRHRYSHERATQYMLGLAEVNRTLNAAGISQDDVKRVSLLACGQSKQWPLRLLNNLIDGDLDADKMDYLLRDGHYCGFAPKFELSDFQDKIRTDFYSGEIHVEEGALNAVNSLLYARFREQGEIHNECKGRIATQVLIEDLRAALTKKQPAATRAEEIYRMHLDPSYDDHALRMFFRAQGREGAMSGLSRGRIGFEEKLVFRFNDTAPRTRGALYVILQCPPAVAEFQHAVRKRVDNPTAIVDVRVIKPTKMAIRVDIGRDYKPTIFEMSDVSAGILSEGARTLAVYIYGREEEDLGAKMTSDELATVAEIVARWATEHSIRRLRLLIGVDLIMLTLHSLTIQQQILFEDIGQVPCWVYGHYYFQRFLGYIADLLEAHLKVCVEYKGLNLKDSEPDLFRDLVVLSAMNLLELRSRHMAWPEAAGAGEGKFLHLRRFDIRMPQAGSDYSSALLSDGSDGLLKVWDLISKAVEKQQSRFSDKYLLPFLRTQHDIETAASLRRWTEVQELADKREILREKILGRGCPLIL